MHATAEWETEDGLLGWLHGDAVLPSIAPGLPYGVVCSVSDGWQAARRSALQAPERVERRSANRSPRLDWLDP